jgi:methyl-accepting chemotaxis protein
VSSTPHLHPFEDPVPTDEQGAVRSVNSAKGIRVQFFRDLSVRAKLFGGFGVVLALTVVLGVVLISQLSSVNGISNTLSTSDFPSVVAINQMYVLTNDYEASTLAGIIETNPAKRASQQQGVAQDATAISADMASYAKLATPGQDTTDYHEAQSEWTAFKAANAPLDSATVVETPATLTLVDTLDRLNFTPLQNLFTAWSAIDQKVASKDTATSTSTYNSARTLGILLLVVALLIGFAIAFLVSQAIKRGVDLVLDRMTSLRDQSATSLRAGIEALAEGDLTVSVESPTQPIQNPPKDEIGQVGAAVNGVIERFDVIVAAYNQTRANLTEIVGQVAGSAGQVSSASKEMASTSDESGRATGEIASAIGGIAEGAERQVQMIDQARRAAEDVSRAVGEAANTAQETAKVATDAREVAQQGVGAAEQATVAMNSVRDSSAEVSEAIRELASKSEQIGQIVQTITGIAQQTNLLALNAAIEAARAGEQGRGFAVVAEEVRKLAEEAQHAAQEISGLISAIQLETNHAVDVVEDGARRTEDGATVVEKTREAFIQIGSSVDDMSARIEQFAAVSQQIAASAQTMEETISDVASVVEESSASTEEVSASTEQTSASAQQISASAQELAGNAETLNELVAQFKLATW